MATMYRHAEQFVIVSSLIVGTSLATQAFAQSVEEQAVLAPIYAMFDGMSKRDAAAVKAATLPGGAMV
jgi:hypothetical protein